MKIKITADSTCDLPEELARRYDIAIIPLYVVLNGEMKKDGIEITADEIFKNVDAGGDIGSTAAVNVADYADVFSRYLEKYDAIIHFSISSDMSTCYQNACIAAEELGNVYPIDSRSLSNGIANLAIDAAIMAEQGMDAADIKTAVDEMKDRLDVSFLLDTLTYLHKGGRCSAVAALGANLLSLRPCIEVRGGEMGVGKKYRGSHEKCLLKYIEDRITERDDIDTKRVFVEHSGLDEELFGRLTDKVRSLGIFDEVIACRAGCTISNHCGPKCFALMFYTK